MDDRTLKWLYDIKIAIDEINSFFNSEKRDFKSYKKSVLLKRAVERELEIIGEAVNRILTRTPALENEISDAKNIIGLRNHVIHAYDNVSDENIWAILINHIPKLEAEVIKLIDSSEV